MPDLIMFNMIAANGMETNSAIMIGDNNATGWDSNNKKQYGMGAVFGLGNVFPANFNLMNDLDVLDTPIVDAEVKSSPNAQA
ncbi:MAG: hypothetical protein ACM3TR_11010 [Caulobacteraceae bacterium]